MRGEPGRDFRGQAEQDKPLLEHQAVDREVLIDKDAKKMWQAALRFSALGLELGAAVLIGYGAGWWLDRQLGTKPYLTLVMLLFGIAAGFRGIVRAAKEAQQAESEDEQARSGDEGKDDKR